MALALVLVTSEARSHDPALHGFNLVAFERPFPAPDFELQNLSAASQRLSDYRGRYVLLNFWATWCPPCLKEMPSMQVLHDRFRTRGFAVLAVSSDEEGRTAVAPFVDRLGVTFPILLDPEQKVSKLYGASALPVTFLLDREGRVVAAAQGAREWDSTEALSVLDEMLTSP